MSIDAPFFLFCGARWRRAGWLALLLGLCSGLSGRRAVTAAKPPTRLALLVGVGQYPQTAKNPWRPLHTHQEIEELRETLIERHGFARNDVLVLEDGNASGSAIREAFVKHLVGRTRRGAVVFFHFSGHGQQIVDRNGDELDGLDESIVPGDAADQSAAAGEKTNILDDELAVWLKQLGEKMRGAGGQVDGSIVLSFDSCFSGTMTRGDLIERGHGWDERDGPRPAARSGSVALEMTRASIVDRDPRDYLLLTATRSDQTAKERDGMGIYSRALIAALTRLPKEVSYRTLLHEITFEVRKAVTNQMPDFEGNLDRLLFGTSAARPGPVFLSLTDVRGDLLTLGAGTLHLVTRGSVYTLHREGEAPIGPSTLLGEAEVIKVEPTTSLLRLRPTAAKRQSESELRRARVVEKEHSYAESPRLRVRCLEEGNGPCKSPQLRAALGRIEAIQLLDTGPGLDTNENGNYDVKLLVKPGVVEFYRPDSVTNVASVPIGGTKDANGLSDMLSPRLRAEWRWLRLFGLRGYSTWAQVGLRLVPVAAHRNSSGLVDSRPQPHLDQAGTSIRLPERALYQLELTNASQAPLWVTILELGLDGGILPLFPALGRPGDGLIAPGTTPRIVPMPYVFETTAPHGTYTLKIITTTERADFATLAQEAAQITAKTATERGRALERRLAVHPLGSLLLDALSGNLVRSKQAPVELGTWSVGESFLEVVPR